MVRALVDRATLCGLLTTDGDWQWLRPAFETWLDPANFDADGVQRQSLSVLTAQALARPGARGVGDSSLAQAAVGCETQGGGPATSAQ